MRLRFDVTVEREAVEEWLRQRTSVVGFTAAPADNGLDVLVRLVECDTAPYRLRAALRRDWPEHYRIVQWGPSA